MTDEVVNIETLIINRRREKNCKCKKPHYEIDTQNHLVYCQDCMAVVEPFEALIQIATHMENINYEIENAVRHKMELMKYKPYLRQAKRYEEMMRQKDMLPLCPKCHNAFNWNEVVEMVNSKLENLDEDRRWCDIELVDNFERLKKDLLEDK